MKSLQPLAFIGMMLLAGTGTAMAAAGSLNGFTPRLLPVLVQVNAQGKVTAASPAMKLSPRLDRLLRQNLDELINQPATDHGRPMASQLIARLALARQDSFFDRGPRLHRHHGYRMPHSGNTPVPRPTPSPSAHDAPVGAPGHGH